MSYFAKILNGIVNDVKIAEPEFFDSFVDSSPGIWIETSKDGSIRKNYAGEGYIYDSNLDAFYTPKPFDSWTLNEDTCKWEAPTAYPDDGKIYEWNDDTSAWDELLG